ncbi:MAG: phosphatidylserine decarboxylase [Eubacterium sp.]|nr:phosphatidylserine decarboxylase [Eubacterium sp.]
MRYIDRNGNIIDKPESNDLSVKFLYNTPLGRTILKPLVHPLFSKIGGKLMNSSLSTLAIPGFIKNNGINMKDFPKKTYRSFNDFFTRRIKENVRPINRDPHTLISPCDSYLSVYNISGNGTFSIKDTKYTLPMLLHSRKLARQFEGGYALVFRLTVSDYHRYIYPVNGVSSHLYKIPGKLNTVNPLANDSKPIYKENAREFVVINSHHFGHIVQMEVGALLVGKITNHKDSYHMIKRGEEKGYFEFGGSTIILLLRENQIELREDLLQNTYNGFETQLHLGDVIGHSISASKKIKKTLAFNDKT